MSKALNDLCIFTVTALTEKHGDQILSDAMWQVGSNWQISQICHISHQGKSSEKVDLSYEAIILLFTICCGSLLTAGNVCALNSSRRHLPLNFAE